LKTFQYRAYDRAGRRLRGLVEADDLKSARDRLQSQGLLPEDVVPVGSGARERRPPSLRASARAVIYRELASLLRAGVPLTRGIEMVIDSPDLAASGPALAGVRDRIREGAPPAAAFAAAGGLTDFETAALEAGQRAGALHEAMERLAEAMEERARLRSRMLSALVYPMVVSALTLVVSVLVLGVMLPRFAQAWTDAGIRLPRFTQAVLGAGRVLLAVVLPAVAVFAAAAVLFRQRLAASSAWRERAARRLLRTPVAGPLYASLVSSRYAQTLSLLLRAGVPLLEGMTMAGRATGSAWVARGAEEESQSVRHGGSLADALRRIPPLARGVAGWARAGEASGDLAGMLDVAARRARDHVDRLTVRSLALLEPLLIVALGAMVFVVALAVFLPILALNQGLRQP
jgi:general secretion pathway protein F